MSTATEPGAAGEFEQREAVMGTAGTAEQPEDHGLLGNETAEAERAAIVDLTETDRQVRRFYANLADL